MATALRKGPMLLGASISGLVVFFALSGLMQLVAPFRVLLFSPVVEVLVVLAAVLLGTMFLLWGRLPGAADRGAYVAAVLVMGLLLVLFQAGAPALGWLGGPVTEAPLLMQGVIYGLSLAALVALLLAGYRWLARRRVWLALAIYVLLSLAMILANLLLSTRGKVARVIFGRLAAAMPGGVLTPEGVLSLRPERLRRLPALSAFMTKR